MLVSFIQMFWAFAILFAACELGHSVSSAFEEINSRILLFHWYKLSKDVKKFLPIIILSLQKPIGLHVFGSIVCGREDFERVSSFWRKNLITNDFHVFFLYFHFILGCPRWILSFHVASPIWQLKVKKGDNEKLHIVLHDRPTSKNII